MKLYILISVILILGCSRYDPVLEKIENDFSLTVTDTAGIRADGRSFITLQLSNSKPLKDGLKVEFQTNKGAVILNNMDYNGNNVQTQLRVAQDTGLYVVKAIVKEETTNKIEKTLTFTLRRAFADSIGLEVDRTLYSLKDPITIRTYLFRINGLVSIGTPVFYRSFQVLGSDTINVGRFENTYNNYSNAEGKLNDIKLFTDSPDIDTLRKVYIQARTVNDYGDTIQKTILIPYK